MLDLLLQVRRSRGVTLVLVTHDPNVAAVADDRLVLRMAGPVSEESSRQQPQAVRAAAMKFVLMMAAREMRASWQRLLFFFVCIAIGVGAIVALRSVIQSVRNTFAGEARSLIAADAIVASNQPLKPEVDRRDRRAAGGRRRRQHALG